MVRNNDLGHLVDLIGALRSNKNKNCFGATVHEDPLLSNDDHRKYQVIARPDEDRYELTCREGSRQLSMTYHPGRQLLIRQDPGEAQVRVEGHDLFPTAPPVLAMFSPLDLPIWGGDRDGQRVVAVMSGAAGMIRLNFTPKDAPDYLDGGGYAIIDLSKCVVTELHYNGRRYKAENITSIYPLTFS